MFSIKYNILQVTTKRIHDMKINYLWDNNDDQSAVWRNALEFVLALI